MSWSVDEIPDQTGRTVLITGGNSGIGLEAGRMLLSRGARVVLACRSEERARDAVEGLRQACPQGEVETVTLDLASLASVRSCADEVRERHPVLDVLVNNAGVMAPPERRTEDGFELQLGTNHLGHFALTGLLLDRLGGPDPRVVTVSSGAHVLGRMDFSDLNWERGYEPWQAYGRSKLANLLFTYALDRRLRRAGSPVKAVACHPGYANTNLQAAGPRMRGARVAEGLWRALNAVVATSAERGAYPTVYAAASPEVRSGDYIGPSGLLQRGRPGRVRSNARSRDEADGERLWEESERLTGVRYPLPPAQGASSGR